MAPTAPAIAKENSGLFNRSARESSPVGFELSFSNWRLRSKTDPIEDLFRIQKIVTLLISDNIYNLKS